MLPSERSTESSNPHAITRVVWASLLLFVVSATSVHFVIARFGGFGFSMSEQGPAASANTLVFALTGVLFLLATAIAQALVSRSSASTGSALSGMGAEQDGRDEKGFAASALGAILVPMAIRFVGTFSALGGLLFFNVVSRNEAVFSVLFWYVTLTTIEIVGIVWTSRATRSDQIRSVTSLGSV